MSCGFSEEPGKNDQLFGLWVEEIRKNRSVHSTLGIQNCGECVCVCVCMFVGMYVFNIHRILDQFVQRSISRSACLYNSVKKRADDFPGLTLGQRLLMVFKAHYNP